MAIVAPLILTACGQSSTTASGLKGEIKIDGSSTVLPITSAAVEEFTAKNPDLKIPVGEVGTGGGINKLISGEIDIADASRAITPEEIATGQKNGIDVQEFKVGFDGISIVVNKANTWATSITKDELKKIWEPNSKIKTWKDVRPEWPAETIKFYTPGTNDGTFAYFTEKITGKAGAMRQDITSSEDDNVLVQGVAGDKNGIGFFGFAYYEANKDKINLVAVDNVKPSLETIKDGSYTPLSRPLFFYVNKKALARKEVKEFVKFYLENGKDFVSQAGYVTLSDNAYTDQLALLK